MHSILRLISYLALTLTVVSPLLVWAGKLSLATNYTLLVIAMFLWFGTAILWIKPERHDQ